jgi:hypothetical protein
LHVFKDCFIIIQSDVCPSEGEIRMSKILIQASRNVASLRALVSKASYHFMDPTLRSVMLTNYRGWVLVACIDDARPGIHGFDGVVVDLAEMHGTALLLAGNQPTPKITNKTINVTASGNASMTVAGGDMVVSFGKRGKVSASSGQPQLAESDPKLVIILPVSDRTPHLDIRDSTVGCRRVGGATVSTRNSNFMQF